MRGSGTLHQRLTFWLSKETEIPKSAQRHTLFILYNYWGGTACPSGIGKTNYRGIRLLNFARKRKITIANTLFPYKVSRETPQHAPNGKTHK